MTKWPKLNLSFRTREEKDAWLEALFRTIKELYQRKSSLKVNSDSNLASNGDVVDPPTKLSSDQSKCGECGAQFGSFVMKKKRHTCRACGNVS